MKRSLRLQARFLSLLPYFTNFYGSSDDLGLRRLTECDPNSGIEFEWSLYSNIPVASSTITICCLLRALRAKRLYEGRSPSIASRSRLSMFVPPKVCCPPDADRRSVQYSFHRLFMVRQPSLARELHAGFVDFKAMMK